MNLDMNIMMAAVTVIVKNINITNRMVVHKNGFNGIIRCRGDFYG